MDNNRTILAVVLIVLLWSGYSLFFSPQQAIQNDSINELKSDNSVVTKDENIVRKSEPTEVTEPVVSVVNIGEEKLINIETNYYNLVLTTKGATIHSFSLNNYKESNLENSDYYNLLKSIEKDSLSTTGSDGIYLPNNIIYNLVTDKTDYKVSNERTTVSFIADTNELTVIKNYIFNPSDYTFDLEVQLINKSSKILSGNLNLSLFTPWDEDNKSELYTFVGPITYDGQDLHEDKPDDLVNSPKIYQNDITWSGFTTKYFAMLVSPKDTPGQLFITNDADYIENKFITDNIELDTNKKITLNYSVYFGPKQYEYLQASNNRFEEIIHYGFFHPLAKPLIVVLKFFYNFTGNYGFSIILLTICIKIIFWPLTQKSYKSMKGMQKLQPEMKRLREKYGSDKQKLNQEMMSFYKEHKVNPLGGCLPMLIQIPVFFALYRVLLGSIELRHAPFMLWITDLSAKDPYYVTPLIMGVTMFLQQKMTPTNMDPTQEKIMLMMPVIFTFMFLNFPSGLVIYWLINNLLTILQQYLIRRQPD